MTDDQSDQLLNILVAQLDTLNRIARTLQTIAAYETRADHLSIDMPTSTTSTVKRIGGKDAKP